MCGIVGMTYLNRASLSDMIYALAGEQHRGQESAGIAVTSQLGKKIYVERGMGEVWQAFSEKNLDRLSHGTAAIGQVRYSTLGESSLENAQPITRHFKGRYPFALVHNGSIVNMHELTASAGQCSSGRSDTHIIADLVAASRAATFEEAILEVAKKLRGGFNLIFLFQQKLYAITDGFGFHPLQIGMAGEDVTIASESCVFDAIGATHVRDIEPGEFVITDLQRPYHIYTWRRATPKFDIFEYIYFMLPSSTIHGCAVTLARHWMGRMLGSFYNPPPNALVVPVADSGNQAAVGFYERLLERGCSVRIRPNGLFRYHSSNVRRTFIDPSPESRLKKLRRKFTALPAELKGQTIILVDDSIVRGTTSLYLGIILREAGVKEIHGAIASPMIINPDLYGIAISPRDHLVARVHKKNVEAIARELNYDSLSYLPLDLTKAAVLKAAVETKKILGLESTLTEDSFYAGPFDGIYPAGTGDFQFEIYR